MKQPTTLTSNTQLNTHLSNLFVHAQVTSFGLTSSKDLFMDMQEQEAAKERTQERQDSFERMSECLYLRH